MRPTPPKRKYWRCPGCGSNYVREIPECGQNEPWVCREKPVPVWCNADTWVNAVLTFVIPLDGVSVDDPKHAKQDAVSVLFDRFVSELPDDLAEHVSSGHWEDVVDDA